MIKITKVFKRWTDQEVSILKKVHNLTKEEILCHFPDRTWKSIIHKIDNLELPRIKEFTRFTDEEIEIIRGNYNTGEENLTNLLPNRTWESIRHKISDLGLEREDRAWTFWSKKEKDILMSCNTLEEVLLKLPKRNKNMITSQAAKLGKVFHNERLWTVAEEEVLKENYSKMTVDEMINLIPGKSRNAIYQKANKLELVNYRYREDIPEEMVIDLYLNDNMMIKDIANKFNVSTNKITSIIPKELRFVDYRLDKEDIIRLYESMVGAKTIAKEYDVSTTVIYRVLKENSIKIRESSDYFELYKADLDMEKICKLYEEGYSSLKLAEMFGVSSATIISRLREHGVEIKPDNSSYISGDNSNFWKGGLSYENSKIRASKEYKLWRTKVLERDSFTCQCCGDTENLQVHHIENFSENIERRMDVDNGIVLCEECHNPFIHGSFHNVYGTIHNNMEQLKEYMQNYKEYQPRFELIHK